MTFDTATLSRPGGREDNEDYCGFHMKDDGKHGGCWVVADGLGGHAGGALASRTAVEAALASYDTNPSGDHVAAAHRAVVAQQNEKLRNEPKLATMRATLVMLITSAESATWAHSGDSRLYHFRSGHVVFQTHDHSVPQRLADAGEIAPDQIRFHEDRNRLLRCLGGKPDPGATASEAPVALEEGDAFLLCTDGFWEYVYESEMEQDLVTAQDAKDWLGRMELRLHARASGENDNYTAIGVLVHAT